MSRIEASWRVRALASKAQNAKARSKAKVIWNSVLKAMAVSDYGKLHCFGEL